MKKMKPVLVVLLLLVLLSGCGATTKSEPKTVPVNQNKEQSSQADNKKAPLNEAEESDIGEDADYKGVVTKLTKKGMRLELIEFVEEGDAKGYSLKGNFLEVELTDKTEFKIYLMKGEKGTLKEADRSGIVVDKSVAIYGSKVGDKLIATKVYILIPDDDDSNVGVAQ